MKYLYRILVFPLVLCLMIFSAIRLILIQIHYFIRYGAEFLIYIEKDTPEKIAKTVDKLLEHEEV